MCVTLKHTRTHTHTRVCRQDVSRSLENCSWFISEDRLHLDQSPAIRTLLQALGVGVLQKKSLTSCATWLIHMYDMTYLCVWHDSSMCVTHDSLMCVTWLIHVCVITHSCVWHDSFTYASWQNPAPMQSIKCLESTVKRALHFPKRALNSPKRSSHLPRVPYMRGGGLGSRPKKMYGERLGDGVEYHWMSPTPRR